MEEQTQNQMIFENDLHQFLSNLEQDEESADNLVDTPPPFKLNQTKNLLGSLLITPTIRKSYSSNLVDLYETNQHMKENRSELGSFQKAQQHKQPPNIDKLNEKTNLMLDEQGSYKESLLKKFSDKLSSLDKSKHQTKSTIDSLRANLNDIELMTANNIFKITSQNIK